MYLFAGLHHNALKMLRRIEEIKLKEKYNFGEAIQMMDTTGSYSLKYRDPVYEDSDYEVILDD